MRDRDTTAVLRHNGAIVHREGRPLVLACVAGLLGAATLSAFRGGTAPGTTPRGYPVWYPGRTVAAIWLAALGFLLQFFRHPACVTPLEPDLVVAPSSGRVVHIGLEEEPEILGDRRLRISTFLSLFDAHLTRSPVGGQITYQRYHPGRYLVALHPKSSTLNERNSILVEHPDGTPVLVRQIAGFLARRICSYTASGVTVTAGEELGFIRLGSRVDLFLPPASTVLVRPGQAVRAGETAIARLPESGGS